MVTGIKGISKDIVNRERSVGGGREVIMWAGKQVHESRRTFEGTGHRSDEIRMDEYRMSTSWGLAGVYEYVRKRGYGMVASGDFVRVSNEIRKRGYMVGTSGGFSGYWDGVRRDIWGIGVNQEESMRCARYQDGIRRGK
jgi:hypothetical protein